MTFSESWWLLRCAQYLWSELHEYYWGNKLLNNAHSGDHHYLSDQYLHKLHIIVWSVAANPTLLSDRSILIACHLYLTNQKLRFENCQWYILAPFYITQPPPTYNSQLSTPSSLLKKGYTSIIWSLISSRKMNLSLCNINVAMVILRHLRLDMVGGPRLTVY